MKASKPIQLVLANPIYIQRAALVAHHGDLQSVLCLEPADQLDHPGVGFRLRKHETPKLSAGERSLFAKHHQRQIFFQRETPLLIGFKGQPIPF
jgi:hypothetical protein